VASPDLYDMPPDAIDYDTVRRFVLDAEAANLLTETLTFEMKEKRSNQNVVEAVAALSNTDGGLVLVGVKEDAHGEDRLVGVRRAEHDAIVSRLRSLIPAALPEVIPVAVPDGDRLILVLRVDADAVLHPVVVAGKVLYRVPGARVPADRQRILELIARDRVSGAAADIASPSYSITTPSDFPLWPEPENSVATVRVVGGLRLPTNQ
jgi:predicted HTH transcriptional regulator